MQSSAQTRAEPWQPCKWVEAWPAVAAENIEDIRTVLDGVESAETIKRSYCKGGQHSNLTRQVNPTKRAHYLRFATTMIMPAAKKTLRSDPYAFRIIRRGT